MVALLLVVGEGYLALTSSKNEGSAFSLPWLPALVVVAVVVAAGVPNRVARTALAVALTGVSLALIASKSGWVAPLATVRAAHVPGLGSVTVTDGRSQIQLEVSGSGYPIGSPDRPLPRVHKRWLPLERAVMGSLIRRAAAERRPLRLVLGMEDGLFSNTRLNLAATLSYHRYRPSFVSYLMTFPDGDNVGS